MPLEPTVQTVLAVSFAKLHWTQWVISHWVQSQTNCCWKIKGWFSVAGQETTETNLVTAPRWCQGSLRVSLRDPVHMGKHSGGRHSSKHSDFKMLDRNICCGILWQMGGGHFCGHWASFPRFQQQPKGRTHWRYRSLQGGEMDRERKLLRVWVELPEPTWKPDMQGTGPSNASIPTGRYRWTHENPQKLVDKLA